ncbi:MAG: Gfo/Idh/MocA family oxidoreductase, partial [Pirellulaceae bacterium]|nr:Gfo/Idh/MocA family oxidoreductase [Pirellulaceae bacterium]
MIVPRHVLGGAGQTPPSERLNMAGIGAAGNRCRQNLKHFVDRKQNVVALADPWDHAEWQGPAKEFREKYYPQAKIYRDYRELFDKEQGLDGVVVVTPDHWHAKISADALWRGIPTYTEKPLTRTISEARILKQIARETGLVT